MGQAYDPAGHALGEIQFGQTKQEVFDKLQTLHKQAAEIRIKAFAHPTAAAAGLGEAGQSPLPQYQCHKRVWALKIKAVTRNSVLEAVSGDASQGSALITPADAGYAEFRVDAEYLRKHNPQPGGYYVVYEDGYTSFSPAEAFESGYTRI